MTKILRDNMVGVVSFLFQHYLQNDGKLPQDEKVMVTALRQVGFHPDSISEGLEWLSGLTQLETFYQAPSASSLHIFTREETLKFSHEARKYLFYLEKNGILTPKNREIVIVQLMHLKQSFIMVADVKWVTLVVLTGQPESQQALQRLEQLILDKELNLS